MTRNSSIGVLITNPLAQPDVTDFVPEGTRIVDLDDLPYHAEPQVRCAFCKHRQYHNDGYFAILSNGQRALCGNCCAAKFDLTKKRMIDQRRVQLKAQKAEAVRRQELLFGLDDLIARADDVDSITKSVYEFSSIFKDAFTDAALKELVGYGVEGLDFAAGCSANTGYVRKVVLGIKGRSEIRKSQFNELRDAKVKAALEISNAEYFIRVCKSFFGVSNLNLISEWVASNGSVFDISEFKLKGSFIHVKARSGQVWKNISLPASIKNIQC